MGQQVIYLYDLGAPPAWTIQVCMGLMNSMHVLTSQIEQLTANSARLTVEIKNLKKEVAENPDVVATPMKNVRPKLSQKKPV